MPMDDSILTSTKKNLGLAEEFTAYDPDIITHINAILSVLHDLGIGPDDGLYIDDEDATWEDLSESPAQTNQVRSWLYLRVRMLFDPPTTSFMIDAVQKQIAEFEWRLSINRDNLVDPAYPPLEEVEV